MKGTDKISEFIKKDKKRLILIIAAAIGILLILIPSQSGKAETGGSLAEYKAELEDELSRLCSSVEGAGRCSVRVTFAEGESFEYRGGNVSASYPPKVLGVAIVCEGADSQRVRSDLIDCMSALFDIGANRVSVLKMK